MRRDVTGLDVRRPLAEYLPGVLREDGFAPRWTAGLDEVLAPIVSTLDCLPAYLDRETAPADLVGWVGSWLGLDWSPSWPEANLRAVIEVLADGYADRGTAAGLRRYLAALTGGQVEIVDPGSARYSAAPGDLPELAGGELVVRVELGEASRFVNDELLDRIVESEKPAHLPHRAEIVRVTTGSRAA